MLPPTVPYHYYHYLWIPPRFFSFQNKKDLLHNKKLRQAQEEKVWILVAISASLPVISEEAALHWVAGVPNLDASIITGAATSLSEEYETSTEG